MSDSSGSSASTESSSSQEQPEKIPVEPFRKVPPAPPGLQAVRAGSQVGKRQVPNGGWPPHIVPASPPPRGRVVSAQVGGSQRIVNRPFTQGALIGQNAAGRQAPAQLRQIAELPGSPNEVQQSTSGPATTLRRVRPVGTGSQSSRSQGRQVSPDSEATDSTPNDISIRHGPSSRSSRSKPFGPGRATERPPDGRGSFRASSGGRIGQRRTKDSRYDLRDDLPQLKPSRLEKAESRRPGRFRRGAPSDLRRSDDFAGTGSWKRSRLATVSGYHSKDRPTRSILSRPETAERRRPGGAGSERQLSRPMSVREPLANDRTARRAGEGERRIRRPYTDWEDPKIVVERQRRPNYPTRHRSNRPKSSMDSHERSSGYRRGRYPGETGRLRQPERLRARGQHARRESNQPRPGPGSDYRAGVFPASDAWARRRPRRSLGLLRRY